MLADDEEPRRAGKPAVKSLDRLGVAELETYVAELRAEIARVENEIIRKRAIQNAAHGVFKTS